MVKIEVSGETKKPMDELGYDPGKVVERSVKKELKELEEEERAAYEGDTIAEAQGF